MNVKMIQSLLAFYFEYWKNPVIPNCFIGSGYPQYEMDLAVVTRAGYLIEVEIKLSKADFMADRKKEKWSKLKCTRLYYCVPQALEEKIRPHLEERFGLIIIKDPEEYFSRHRVQGVKKAQKIKGSVPLDQHEIAHMLMKNNIRYWKESKQLNSEDHNHGDGI